MTEDVIKALARTLTEYFKVRKKKYTIYTESVEQSLKKPCFFIYCKDYKDEPYRGKRYKVSADIVIEYIPNEKEEYINADVNGILSALYDATELVKVDGSVLRGINRQVENADGCVVFSVKYEYFYYKTDDIETMEILKERTDVNG